MPSASMTVGTSGHRAARAERRVKPAAESAANQKRRFRRLRDRFRTAGEEHRLTETVLDDAERCVVGSEFDQPHPGVQCAGQAEISRAGHIRAARKDGRACRRYLYGCFPRVLGSFLRRSGSDVPGIPPHAGRSGNADVLYEHLPAVRKGGI